MKRLMVALAMVAAATPVAAQQPAATERSTLAAKTERPICKRSAPSGSLVPTRRECHTRSEWNDIAQSGRAQAQDMVDRAAPTGTKGN
jgi:hypothetical protein